jgi:hypothetical protein
MFVFTDWVDSGEVKYFIGWFMIVLTMIYIGLNEYLLVMKSIKKLNRFINRNCGDKNNLPVKIKGDVSALD